MESFWPQNLASDQMKAIDKLIRGREIANKLLLMFSNPLQDHGPASAENLIEKILVSFSETISILNSSQCDEVSQVPAGTRDCSPSQDGRKSEDSSESYKTSATKDRRGCYKRRRTSQTWTKESPTLVDDGHAWRKYGQKVILHAKYPRNYFRCTHKYDQGCGATKQVQRVKEEPPIYRTTYHGLHTCNNFLRTQPIILDSTVRDSSSILLSFETNDNSNNNKQNDPYLPVFPSIKHEPYGEVSSLNKNQPSSSDYFLSPDLMTIGMPGPIAAALSSGSDHGDVISTGMYSCTASTHSHSIEMDMIVGPLDFEDVLQFEYCEN